MMQAISLALSQKSAGIKGDNCGGPCENGEDRFTGQGTSLGVQMHAAVVDALACRLPQHDGEHARV